jgi:hypothetical protein
MIRLKNRIALVLLSVLLLIFLAGCMSETETFIQGYWYRGNVHFMDQWYFDRGFFSHETGIFIGHPDTYTGRYQVLEYTDDSLIIELDNTNLSYGDGRPQFVVKIDKESDTISIRSQIYERIIPDFLR